VAAMEKWAPMPRVFQQHVYTDESIRATELNCKKAVKSSRKMKEINA
jgi:hypothetical protein